MSPTAATAIGTRSIPPEAMLQRLPRHIARGAALYACGVGVVTLVGWTIDAPTLTSWKQDGIAMFPNSSLCAVLSGIAVWLGQGTLPRWQPAVRALGIAVALIGGLTLLEHLADVNLGIDELLFRGTFGQRAAAAPMRMGPPASTAFLTLGIALALVVGDAPARRVAMGLGSVAIAIGTLSLVGHLYGASEMYTIPRLTGIAMQTASAVFALGIAVVASVPEREPMRTLVDPGAAGMLARQAWPLIVLCALTLGAVRVFIEDRGLADGRFGTAMRTVVEMGLLTGLLWWAAARVRLHEQARQLSEAELRRKAAQLAAFLDTAAVAMHRVGPDGTILWANDAELQMLGYRADEYVGRSIARFHADQDVSDVLLARLRRGERLCDFEARLRCRDGTIKEVLIDSSVFRDEGEVVHAQCFTRDVTESRRGAAQREELLRIAQQARAEAEAMNRAKDEFLAMLGHELRNPLAAIRNAIAVAVLDRAGRDRAVEIARRQAEQLGRIVDDLLDVARITQGRVRLRRELVALADVVERSVEGARPLMAERGHTLELELPPAPIHLLADAARLEQAIANLLTNAAKYTDPGGVVTVRAERDGDTAVIRVRDTGIGIAPEALGTVFDLFAQGERSLDRAQGGLGIGLTVVRRIVELHGGTVAASSPGPGGGAEFVLVLPAVAAETESAPAVTALATRRGADTAARVLVVEDQPDAAESLMMLLEVLGHHVRVVHDGRAALEAARAATPDVMLVDIGLPGMDGYEVAQAIRADPRLRVLLLVALTGYGRPEDKARALAAGFDHHLVKPVDMGALGDLLARIAARDDEARALQS